jgi:hypothetical protein
VHVHLLSQAAKRRKPVARGEWRHQQSWIKQSVTVSHSACPSAFPSREAAPGVSRSEPLVEDCIIKSPGRAKEADNYIFRPFRAPFIRILSQGFAAAHPWLLSVGPPGLSRERYSQVIQSGSTGGATHPWLICRPSGPSLWLVVTG